MTTNHKRWTVRIHQSHRNGSKCPKSRWVVDPPGFDYKKRAEHTGNWHRAGGNWFQWDKERTKREAWKEALAYADRMARIVEVTLPRIGSQFTYKQRATPSYDDITITKANSNNYQIRYAEDMGADGRGIDMLADELKTVALALLAHHYRGTTP